MKKFIIILLAAFLYGCKGSYLDTLWNSTVEAENDLVEQRKKIDEVEKMCADINSNIKVIKASVDALRAGDQITTLDVLYEDGSPIGYTLGFQSGKKINIYNGKNVYDAPSIAAARRQDGFYYWTVNGQMILDDKGNGIRIEGTSANVPKVRINGDEYWEISYDGGLNWEVLGKASGSGDATFKDIKAEEGVIVFTLHDGSSFTLPRTLKVTIELDVEDEADIEPGKDIRIGFRLTNASENTEVTVASDGNYAAEVFRTSQDEGYFIISSPKYYEDGYVTIVLYDGTGYTTYKVISFYERKIEVQNISTDYQAKHIQLPVTSNFSYHAEVSPEAASWLSIIEDETRAEMKHSCINVSVAENRTASERKGVIMIFPDRDSAKAIATITINQYSASFTIEKDIYYVTSDGGKLTIPISSSKGVDFKLLNDANWLTVTSDKQKGPDCRFEADIQQNHSSENRTAIYDILSYDGQSRLSSLKIVSLGKGKENPEHLIFKVLANEVNGYKGYIPIVGNLDCDVDWGDGTKEHYRQSQSRYSDNISHQYASREAEYTVRISGTVQALSSWSSGYGRYQSNVTEVVQWGQTGLTSLEHAFLNDKILVKVPDDEVGSFAKVSNMDMMFSHCTALKTVPKGIFSFISGIESINHLFADCTSLESLPDSLFSNNSELLVFHYGFYQCTSLKSIPESLFAGCPDMAELFSTFSGCSSLENVPTGIFNNCTKIYDFCQTFGDCSLKGETPYTVINGQKVHLYERYLYPDYFETPIRSGGCFTNSYELSDWKMIPDNWK